MNKFVRLASVFSVAILSGCATTHYQCPTPTGVACMSATEVYHLTDAPGKAGTDAATGALTKDGHGHGGKVSAPQGAVATASSDRITPLPKPGDVIPIREPSRVMRIWIGPWQDTSGNLVMATRIYTEIEPKRWSIGEDAGHDEKTLFPMQVDVSKPTVQTTNVSQGAPTVAPGTEPQHRF